MQIEWENGFVLRATDRNGEIVLSGNPAGLRSLAGILMALAEESAGSHVHLDVYNALEEGSRELILERTDEE